MSPVHPETHSLEDRTAAERWHRFYNMWFLDTVMHGKYPDAYLNGSVEDHVEIRAGDMDLIKAPLDFIGINLYTRAVVAHDSSDHYMGVKQVRPKADEVTEFGWEVYPQALSEMIVHITKSYPGIPDLRDRERMFVRRRAGCRRQGQRSAAGQLPAAVYLRGRGGDEGRRGRARLFPVDVHRQLRMGGRIPAALRNRALRLQDAAEDRQGKRALVLAAARRQARWISIRSFDMATRAAREPRKNRLRGGRQG